ncbi:cytochrome P450 27C1-like [Saccoglossus kowalevskii]
MSASRSFLPVLPASRRFVATVAAIVNNTPPSKTTKAGQNEVEQTPAIPAPPPQVKPFGAIPSPGFFGNLVAILRSGIRLSHLVDFERHQKFGPIVRVHMGDMVACQVSAPHLIEEVLRNEGKYPKRFEIIPWKEYREKRGLSYGLLTAEGEEWHRNRNILSKRMLRPKHVSSYTGILNDVSLDLVSRFRDIRDENQKIPKIDNELYKWAFESVCSVLFETRMGCLGNKVPADTQKFIAAITQMFVSQGWLFVLPLALHRNLKSKPYTRHMEAWDTIFDVATRLVQTKIKSIFKEDELGNNKDTNEEHEAEFLTYILSTQKLSLEEIIGNITEILLAGVDTTSNTMMWALYELVTNPDCLNRLVDEVDTVLKGKELTQEQLPQMKYMKCVIKETLRKYPVLTASARVLEKDIVLSGFHIPKHTVIGTMYYVMGRDPKLFDDPKSFRPERWLRSPNNNLPDGFSSIPFGFGPRMCIGNESHCSMYLIIYTTKFPH